jgi:hypothetical protein
MTIHGLKILRLFLVSLLVFASSSITHGQSKDTFNEAAATQEAKTQLTSMALETGELTQFAAKNEIKGEFVFDITLQGKGDVLTVYMVSATSEDIAKKNLLKDKLHALRLENIKIPKKEKIKLRHTFIF